MRRTIGSAALVLLVVGCGLRPNSQPAPAQQQQPQQQPGAPPARVAEQRQQLPLEPDWQKFAMDHYQSPLKLMMDDPRSAVFPPGESDIVAEYLPAANKTYLTMRGAVNYRDANGAEQHGSYFVRWWAPGRATAPETPWKIAPPFAVSPAPAPATTTASPGEATPPRAAE
jgi:hypothetical protein